MKASKAIEAAAAGCVVYVLMAACGGGGGGGGFLADAATDLLGSGGNGGAGGLLSDVLGDPVPDAHAAPPEIKEAPCVGTPGGYYNAEIAVPGKTVNQLGRADVLIHYLPPYQNGYDWVHPGSFAVKDGSISVYCYHDSGGAPKADFVRAFVPVD